MNALLALLSAGAFGSGDFLGGIATRKVGSALPVVVYSHVVGLVLVVALIPAFPGSLSGGALAAGIVAGLIGTVGLALLYRGLAIGRMSVVAPVTGVGAAVIFLAATRRGFLALVAVLASLYPAVTIVLARFLLDERLGRVQMLGLGVAGIGVVLIAAG